MIFGKKRRAADVAQNDPILRRAMEIERLEEEREALSDELEALLKEYSSAIGSREPLKGARPVGTQPNEYSFWHKKRRF